MFKLISLDLDGTLFDNKMKISDRNIKAIKACHEAGCETVVATGRPPRFTFDVIPNEISGEYCVCYNGAQIYYNQDLIYEQVIRGKDVKDIIQYVKNQKDKIRVALESKNIIYCNFDLETFWPGFDFKPLEELKEFDHVCKILLIDHKSMNYEAFMNRFKDTCYIIQTDSGNLIEIMEKSVSKYEAIKWIAKRMSINVEDVMAFGDDLNDMEIIKGVGKGVAMGNGHKAVKEIAKEVTLSNDEDGVAVILEKMLEVKDE